MAEIPAKKCVALAFFEQIASPRVILGRRSNTKNSARLPVLATVALAMAQAAQADMTKNQAELIDVGFEIFTEETFEGNGRTCATCHIPEENYNIFPSTIKKMKEKDRDLVFARNVPGLENEDLIKEFALFNVSGSPDARATHPEEWADLTHPPHFRSTMSVQALDLTRINSNARFEGSRLLPTECNTGVEPELGKQQFGWAGDGAPGSPLGDPEGADKKICRRHHGSEDINADGTLRAFANGAIAQHMPLRLERVAKSDVCDPDINNPDAPCHLPYDFRFATDHELDAMEAFQNWLGRRAASDTETEFDLDAMGFADARIIAGRDHFVEPPETSRLPNFGAGCDGCHTNGGAHSNIGRALNGIEDNINIDTGVELASHDIGIDSVGFALPHDEGGYVGNGPVGLEGFNVQSIIEASSKKAYFHNHRTVSDIEDAITFYFSEDFIGGVTFLTDEAGIRFGNPNAADFGRTNHFPNGDGVEHLGAFLRSLEAWYRIRDCERLVEESIKRIGWGVSTEVPVLHCELAIDDVREVLKNSHLKPRPYHVVYEKALVVRTKIRHAANNRSKNQMKKAIEDLRNMRDTIAVVSEAP